MRINKKWFFAAILLVIAAIVIGGCARSQQNAVQIKGSDTMSPLSQAWAEEFRKTHPNIDIAVTGGGSGVGIAALENGTTDIAMSSRSVTKEELDAVKAKGNDPKEFQVASDGIVVIVNPSNPVSKLTIAQLSRIFTGEITNWKDVGGANAQIVLLSRDKNSGTHLFFLEHVVRESDKNSKKQFAAFAQLFVSNQPIAQQVETNKNAIGYVGLGYFEPNKHKAIAVAKTPAGPYVMPSETTVLSNDYPISRKLFYYTPKPPAGAVKEFIDYTLNPEGQKLVEKVGFVPIKRAKG